MTDPLGFIGIEEVEESEVEQTRDFTTRTVNPYATDGPGDGRTWNELFKEVRHDDDEERAKVAENVVTIPGHEIPVEELPKNILAVAKLIPDVKARHSQTFHEGEVFKSGDRKGEKRPDKTVDHYAIGYHEDGWKIVASWSDTFNYGLAVQSTHYFYTEKVTEFKAKMKEVFND